MIPYAELVGGVLELAPSEVHDGVSPATHGSWTSLKHLQLVVAVEENYGVSLTSADIRSMTSLGEVRNCLRARGVVV
jgi:acyl carrier protein